MAIDISKQYRTSSGLDVKGLRIDPAMTTFCVKGIVLDAAAPGGEMYCSWTLDGRYSLGGTDARDLVEAPERVRKPKPRLLVSTDKQYRTIEGKEVRIYSTNNGGNYPVHGAWRDEIHNEWFIREWTAEGNQCITPRDTDPYNLVEVKPRIQLHKWANVYEDGSIFSYPTKKEANDSAQCGRFALIEIDREVEEGEGLE